MPHLIKKQDCQVADTRDSTYVWGARSFIVRQRHQFIITFDAGRLQDVGNQKTKYHLTPSSMQWHD